MTHSNRLALLIFGSAIAAGCRKLTTEFEKSVDDIAATTIVDVDATSAVPQQDSKQSVAVLSARIPMHATSRAVIFTTSNGLFVENATKTITVRAVPDPSDSTRLVARTSLRDSVSETAVIRAAVGEFYDTVSVRFAAHP